MRAKHIIQVAAAVLACLTVSMAAQTHAEMWDWTKGDITYKVVEADSFYSDETAGNTARVTNPGTYWAIPEGGDVSGYWYHRSAFGFEFNTLGGSPASASDAFEAKDGVPDLRTTITGLADGTYEVFLVHGLINDDPWNYTEAMRITWAHMKADIDVGQPSATTVRKRDALGVVWTGYKGSGSNNIWELALNPLGQVTGTGFSVLVDDSYVSHNNPNRGLYTGVAYYLVPEPSTLALLATGLIGLLCYAWRKRK